MDALFSGDDGAASVGEAAPRFAQKKSDGRSDSGRASLDWASLC
jgi:hypothetical protein